MIAFKADKKQAREDNFDNNKKIKDAFDDLVDAKRIVREIRLLRHFNHDNIIRIVDLPVPDKVDFDDIYIVTDLMETDLHK